MSLNIQSELQKIGWRAERSYNTANIFLFKGDEKISISGTDLKDKDSKETWELLKQKISDYEKR